MVSGRQYTCTSKEEIAGGSTLFCPAFRLLLDQQQKKIRQTKRRVKLIHYLSNILL
jgi:small neutral amino acid transporter SnatA (MarC family)